MQDFSHNHREPVSTLRIKSHEQDKILRLLEAEQNASQQASKRKSERCSLPDGVGVTACISQPGGTSARFAVRGINLSEHGIGFIHGGYVHGGSKAIITLVTAEGERFSINGIVKRCEYVTNGVHSVGVEFDAPFDVEGFLGGVEDDAGPNAGQAGKLRSVRVAGQVLVLDDSAAARRLTAYQLSRIGATVLEAGSVEEACRILKHNDHNVDLLLCDVWFGHQALPGFIERLREAHAKDLSIVAYTGDERQETHERVKEAGCAEVLVKPAAPALFNETVARYLETPDAPAGSGNQRQVVSELWSDLAMRPLIIRYVRDLEALVRQLDADLGNIETKAGKVSAYNACMRIGADAAAYGYPSIQSIGNTMCMLIDGGAETAELQTQLVDLQARVDAALCGI